MPWRHIWAVALVGVLSFVVAAEVGFRVLGFEPMVQDDVRLWSHWRSVLEETDKRTPIVLLGTSRMQLGVDPAILQEELGSSFRVINLSINGGSPLPVLRHLASDEAFSGVVISGLHPRAFFGEMTSWERKTQLWLDLHEQRAWSDPLESRLRHFFQQRLVILLPSLRPEVVFASLVKHGVLPEPLYISARFDRYLAADYTKLAHEQLSRSVEFEPDLLLSPRELEDRVSQLRRDVSAITDRGGEVLFLRMVSSGNTLIAENSLCPREQFYDPLVDRVPDATFIHFADDVELSQFSCPDGGHLDHRDAGRYSRRVAELIARSLRR